MEMLIAAGEYFTRGGFAMWPLLICSLASIVIAVERYLYYRRAISENEFITKFCELINELNFVEAKELAEHNSGYAAKMAVEALNMRDELGKCLESIVFARADRYIEELYQYLNYVSVIVGLAPMLGLLGTITGMMASFSALHGRMQNPGAVTAGIGEALITTVFGLCIAIVGMCLYAYLSSKVKAASLNIYEIATVITDVTPLCNKGRACQGDGKSA